MVEASLSSTEPRAIRALAAAQPVPALVLDTDLRIVEANELYLRSTLTWREDLVGRPMFEAFPDNPSSSEARATEKLSASLQRVLATGVRDAMPLQPAARASAIGFCSGWAEVPIALTRDAREPRAKRLPGAGGSTIAWLKRRSRR